MKNSYMKCTKGKSARAWAHAHIYQPRGNEDRKKEILGAILTVFINFQQLYRSINLKRDDILKDRTFPFEMLK